MDAALELFLSSGYEKTMVADIVKKAGVAKGTFFYYFPTKEAVLAAICTRWAAELATDFQRYNQQFTALKKLQAFILQLTTPAKVDQLIEKLWNEKQLQLLYTIWQQHVETIFNPILTSIIEQGNQEGTMHVHFIQETVAFFWSTLDCLWDAAYMKEPAETVLNKTKIAAAVLERILGIEDGLLELSPCQFGFA